MDLHENDLQLNLYLKQKELESLISIHDYTDFQCDYWKSPYASSIPPQLHPKYPGVTNSNEIVFQHFQYKVFREPELFHQKYAAKNTKRRYVNKNENTINYLNLPYPEDSEICLEALKIVLTPRRITTYEKIVIKLNAATRYLRETSKIRESLFELGSGGNFIIKKMILIPNKDDFNELGENENFSQLIEKSVKVVETSTIEINLIRGMIQHIEGWYKEMEGVTAMTIRVHLRDLEQSIESFVSDLNMFISQHKFLRNFNEFNKGESLLESVKALVNCIRAISTYLFLMKNRLKNSAFKSDSCLSTKMERDLNIGS